jgi:hypothetical protein
MKSQSNRKRLLSTEVGAGRLKILRALIDYAAVAPKKA